MNRQRNVRMLTVLALMTALLVLFSLTPVGSIPVGPLVITLNVIPVAIAAIALGPWGGCAMGCVFGILSFLQCFGVGVPSGMGAVLVAIDPLRAFLQRFLPRALDGMLVGLIFSASEKRFGRILACFFTGFSSALFNTTLFMGALVLLFGDTDYVQGLMDGRNVFAFIFTFVGVNAAVEMLFSTIVTGLVGSALFRAKLLPLRN